MGRAAILVMWPRPVEQLFFPKGPEGCIWNLVAIGLVVTEEKSFEIRLKWAKNVNAITFIQLTINTIKKYDQPLKSK